MDLKETILAWAKQAGVSHGPLAGMLHELSQELLTVRPPGTAPPRPTEGLLAKGHWWPGNMMRWRVVDLASDHLISEGESENGSINVAEFMAILVAVQYADEMGLDLPIYSPSVVAVQWVKRKLFKTSADTPLWIREKVRRFNSTNYNRGAVTLWETDCWGPSPAAYQEKEYTMKWVAR